MTPCVSRSSHWAIVVIYHGVARVPGRTGTVVVLCERFPWCGFVFCVVCRGVERTGGTSCTGCEVTQVVSHVVCILCRSRVVRTNLCCARRSAA